MSADRGPDVSVVIPVHNRAHLLPVALSGVREQRAPVVTEVIVVDDCSTDDTAGVAAAHGVRVIRHHSNRGPGAARDTGLAAARGEWIAFLDSDDCWASDHLATLWAARSGHVLVSSSGLTRNQGGTRVLGSPFLRPVVLRSPRHVLRPENLVTTAATMVRADALRAAGGFSHRRYAEDLEVWIRVLEHGTGVVLPQLTLAVRRHDGQISNESNLMRDGLLRVLQVFEDRPWCDPRLRRSVAVTVAWDSNRARQDSPLSAASAAVRAGTPLDLGVLLGRRALLRRRWRLPGMCTEPMLRALDEVGVEADDVVTPVHG